MKWFIKAAKPFKGMDIKVVSETIDHPRLRSRRCWPRPSPRSPASRSTHDIIQEGDVVEKLQTQMQSGQNIYDAYINDSDLDRHPLPLQQDGQPDRLDGRRGQGRDQSDPRRRRLHRQVVHHRARRQAVPAARPAVRQPVLVPLRLVHRPADQGRVQGQVRLRPRRAGQLVGLRGHRRVLHQRREGDRRRAGLRPHGLRQEGPVARLALHRRLALDGRQGRQGHPQRPAGRRMGHPHGGLPSGRLLRRPAAAAPTARRRSTRSRSTSTG